MENLLVSKLACWAHGCPREREGGKWHHMHHFLVVQMTPNAHLSTPSLWFLSDVSANLALPYNPTPIHTELPGNERDQCLGVGFLQYKGDFKERDSCEGDFKAFCFCSPEISVVLALQGREHNYIFCRKDKVQSFIKCFWNASLKKKNPCSILHKTLQYQLFEETDIAKNMKTLLIESIIREF